MRNIKLNRSMVHQGNLILVNKDNKVKNLDYSKLVEVNKLYPDIVLENEMSIQLIALMNSINGWNEIALVSGWRSFKEQTNIYDQSLHENGKEFTSQFVALPGCSEHQTGLAIDVGIIKPNIDFICPDFPYTGIAQIFREKATSFGFIERYLKGKEEITFISSEPWHFRYVGIPHSLIMKDKGMVLEEYVEFVHSHKYGENEFIFRLGKLAGKISYIHMNDEELTIEIDDTVLFTISGDNKDGFILAEWSVND